MLFLNSIMLFGLLGITVPLLLHLFNRRKSSQRPWGAMMFLSASLAQRRRRVLIEEILLLATRCLIAALAAVAFARPFVSAGSNAITLFTAAAGLLSVILFAASSAVWSERRLRARLWIASGALALFAVSAVLVEGFSSWIRTSKSGAKDIAIIIDGSASMTITSDGVRNFDKAREIADDFIQSSPRNTAFSLIIGGSVSQELTKSPTTDRQLLLRLLDEAVPLQGTLKAPDALALAVTSLAQGYNGNKQIVVIGDGQSTGWALGDEQVWSGISELLSRLPQKPSVIWRTLPIPAGLRNITVDAIAFSREIIGTDREVRIDVSLVNNGTESATPESLTLHVEGKTMKESAIGQILPGEKRIVPFRHKFAKAGSHAVVATLEIDDELTSDNSATRIAAVRSGFSILVVEGAAARRFADRPGAFIALALSPDSATVAPAPAAQATKPGQPAQRPGNNAQLRPPRSSGFLVKPQLVSAAALNSISNLNDYSVIVLADVPKIPSNTAARVAAYVERGGGLLTVHSLRTSKDFYNSWRDPDGAPLMPLVLEGEGPLTGEGSPLDPKSLLHPALSYLAEHGDLATALFEKTWKTSEAAAQGVRVGGRLFNGAPLFADRKYGKGRILQFAAALDPASGNLISRQSFLPLVHELVYYIARPVVPNLNIGPSRGATIQLAGGFLPDAQPDEQPDAAGLRGIYFADAARSRIVKIAIDQKSIKDWRHTSLIPSLPPDAIVSAEWTGSISVPRAGRYTLFAESPYAANISLADAGGDLPPGKKRITADLTPGRRTDIRITYTGKNRINAYLIIKWQAEGIPPQQIPDSCFSPVRTSSADWTESFATTFRAPDSTEPLPALINLSRNSLSVRISHRLTPGLYAVNIPLGFAPALKDLAAASGIYRDQAGRDILPVLFCVSTDGSESLLSAVTPEEAAFARRFAELTLASDDSEMDRAVNGAKVGRELWRYAAVPLLVLILLEILLTRWITIQRRTGQEGKVEFDESSRPNSRFTEILQRMRDGGLK